MKFNIAKSMMILPVGYSCNVIAVKRYRHISVSELQFVCKLKNISGCIPTEWQEATLAK